jgi:uncharacterized membrane protein
MEALVTPTEPNARTSRLPLALVCAAMLVYAVTFSTMQILMYRAGTITYTDTASFEEMLWRTLHGEFLVCSSIPHMLLGSHIQVIHLFMLPVYVICPNLQTLMVSATVALALGALPVYGLARHVLKSPWVACALAVAYLLYTPMQMVNIEDGAYNAYRPIAYSIPLFLAAFYYLAKGRTRAFLVCCVLVLLCKQEFALTLMMLGLYLAVVQRRRRLGLGMAVFCLVYVAVAMKVVIPAIRGGTSHTVSYYSHLGDSWGQIVWNTVSKPMMTFRQFFPSAPEEFAKYTFYKVMLFSAGFVCLLSPLLLLVALPALAICMLSVRPDMWSPVLHYHAPIVPIVFAATVYGIRNLSRLATRHGESTPAAARRIVGLSGWFVLLCALGTNVLYSKSPLSLRFYDARRAEYYGHLYVATPHALRRPEVVASVPTAARVSASLFICTYFTHHQACYVFPDGIDGGHRGPVDVVVVDLEERWLFDQPAQREVYEALLASPAWERLPAPDGYVILRRIEESTYRGEAGGG